MRAWFLTSALFIAVSPARAQESDSERQALIARARYYMNGAGSQFTIIVPSHDLVVVRLGHYRGAEVGRQSLGTALSLLMQAVPSKD